VKFMPTRVCSAASAVSLESDCQASQLCSAAQVCSWLVALAAKTAQGAHIEGHVGYQDPVR
jgi:hypothetical protein